MNTNKLVMMNSTKTVELILGIILSSSMINSEFLPTFCTDLVRLPLSLEDMDAHLPFLGTESHSISVLVSAPTKLLYKPVIKNPCLMGSCGSKSDCRTNLRAQFFNITKQMTTQLGQFKLTALNETEFLNYVNKKKSMPTYGLQMLFRVGCLTMCSFLTDPGHEMGFDCICPNPCTYQKSCSFAQCKRFGWLNYQYECTCGEGEVWNKELVMCIPVEFNEARSENHSKEYENDPTGCKQTNDCNPNGTLFCNADIMGKNHICLCKPQFTGQKCETRVNACTNHVQHPHLPGGGLELAGNAACNVNMDNNTCRSLLNAEGDISFKCHCNESVWIPNHVLIYDNCLKRRTMCDSILCVYGKCVSDDEGKQPYCICDLGYRGSQCSDWSGVWSEWSPWDKCSPACGDVRYTVRTRDCETLKPESTLKKECLGAAIEYAQCAEHLCARTEGTFINTYFAVRQNGLSASIAGAAVVCAIFTGLWSTFCWSVISRVLSGLA